jgi:4-carboxymuconolactone decarboxylase
MADSNYEGGLAVRRDVLGADYVDASIARADGFTAPFQKWVTENCWGALWTRAELSRRDRSLVNIGMLCALNRSEELKLHLRGALNNGVTVEEIREVMFQVSVYCGFPAAVTGIRVASELFKEDGVDVGPKP